MWQGRVEQRSTMHAVSSSDRQAPGQEHCEEADAQQAESDAHEPALSG
jgi:hypothetical protein